MNKTALSRTESNTSRRAQRPIWVATPLPTLSTQYFLANANRRGRGIPAKECRILTDKMVDLSLSGVVATCCTCHALSSKTLESPE
jgi:hypothetical protein